MQKWERLLSGIVLALCCAVAFVLYSAIIMIFLTRKNFSKYLAYVVMSHIGILELFQLAGNFVMELFKIFNTTFHPLLAASVATVVSCSYMATMPFHLTLASNRLLVLCEIDAPFPHFYTMCICFAWLYGVSFFCAFLSPFAGIGYDLSEFKLRFDFSAPLTPLLVRIESSVAFTCLGLSFLIYLAVVVNLVRGRRRLIISSRDTMITNRELRVLVQAVVMFLFCTFIVCLYHFGQLFPPFMLNPNLVSLLSVFYSGYLNALMYILMNRELREELRALFVVRNQKMVEMTTISAHDDRSTSSI